MAVAVDRVREPSSPRLGRERSHAHLLDAAFLLQQDFEHARSTATIPVLVVAVVAVFVVEVMDPIAAERPGHATWCALAVLPRVDPIVAIFELGLHHPIAAMWPELTGR